MNRQQKTSAIKLLVLSAAFSAQPSYSDYEFGYSNNAALGGSSWGMSDTLFPVPSIQGVDINGVFYRYTAVKELGDPYTVSIQNEDAINGGYIFRETDDWSGGSGGTIQKFIPLPYSPLGNWGEGSIDEVGLGRVEDATVLYSYRFDPERVQQPEIPDLPTYDIYDSLSDRYVLDSLEPTDPDLYDSEESQKDDTEEEDDGRLETALAAQENAITLAGNISQGALVKAMNTATNMNSYYSATINGGKYQETIVLIDKNIPDNRRALRSMGQDKLHTKMIDQQYGR